MQSQFEKARLKLHLHGQQEVASVVASVAIAMGFSFAFTIVSALQKQPSVVMSIALGSSVAALASLSVLQNRTKDRYQGAYDRLAEDVPENERYFWRMPEDLEAQNLKARLKGVALAGVFTALCALPVSGVAAGAYWLDQKCDTSAKCTPKHNKSRDQERKNDPPINDYWPPIL